MPLDALFLSLVLLGVVGGTVAGLGGPGGLVVIVALNVLVALPPTVAAVTASSIFIVATLTATGLYASSDGIDWSLVPVVALPALVGAHAGTRIAPLLSPAVFEGVLVGVFGLLALGIALREGRPSPSQSTEAGADRSRTLLVAIGTGSLGIGVLAGITGIGGPALAIPLLLFSGLRPVVAIGAGVASGVVVTTNATLGHVLQGTVPDLGPMLVLGVPFVCAQVVGWRYVHLVSDRTVSYSIAGLALAGSLAVLLV